MIRMRALAALMLAACAADDPPTIVSASLLDDTPDAHGPYRVTAKIVDDRSVARAAVLLVDPASLDDVPVRVTRVEMGRLDGDTFATDLPGMPLGTTIVWGIEAEDGAGQLTTETELRTYTIGNVPSKPEILTLFPAEGPATGGTEVLIVGRDLRDGIAVTFDGAAATGVDVLSRSQVRATTPPGDVGLADVELVNADGAATAAIDGFRYTPVPPLVLSINPDRGTDLGGTAVTIEGQWFDPDAQVYFDDRLAPGTVVVSSVEIRSTTPPHPAGPADVRVRNPSSGLEGVLEDGFTFYGPPEIHRVEPPYAASEGGATVTIAGASFDARTRATMGAIDLQCTFVDPELLDCTTPIADPGPYPITVRDDDGRSDTLEAAITLFLIEGVEPTEGPASGGNGVAVRGQYFPRVAQVFFGASLARCTWITEGAIDCVAPPGPPDTFVDVDVLPPDPGQVPSRLAGGYYYVPPPEVLQVIPDFGPLRGGQRVRIVGRHFMMGATVTIDGNACTNVVFISETELECTVPPGTPGLKDVTVTNPDRQSGTRRAYEYVPITFTPEWGLVDGWANLDIRGAGFAPNAAVTIGGVAAEGVVFVDGQRMLARAPARGVTGSVEVVVANPGETPEVSPSLFSYRVYRDRSVPSMAGAAETSDVLIVDLDADGDEDLVYVNGSVSEAAESETLENRMSGQSFSARNLGFFEIAHEGSHCDTDLDGLPDLVWGASGSIRVMRNLGGFAFNPITPPGQPGSSFEASFHDVTGDGRCDLINVSISDPDTVLRNDNGTFNTIANALPHDPGFVHDHKIDSGDLDGDGDNDLILMVDDTGGNDSPTQRNRVYLNDGDGSFTEDLRNQALMESIHGDVYDVRIGDLDLDGDLDAVAPNYSNPPVVLMNAGDGTLSLDASRLPADPRTDSALFLEDIEGDGDFDLYLVNLDNTLGTSALFLNDGTGVFARAVQGEPFAPPGSYRAAAGDLNGDRATDIVLGVVFGPNRMYFALE
jgi:hypothetical protein